MGIREAASGSLIDPARMAYVANKLASKAKILEQSRKAREERDAAARKAASGGYVDEEGNHHAAGGGRGGGGGGGRGGGGGKAPFDRGQAKAKAAAAQGAATG
jgi:hypothetical protein